MTVCSNCRALEGYTWIFNTINDKALPSVLVHPVYGAVWSVKEGSLIEEKGHDKCRCAIARKFDLSDLLKKTQKLNDDLEAETGRARPVRTNSQVQNVAATPTPGSSPPNELKKLANEENSLKEEENLTSLKQQLQRRVETEIKLKRSMEQLKTENMNLKAGHKGLALLFILSYSVFSGLFVWFLYWILFDVIVWNKSFFQANLANYFGLIVMVGLVLYETKIVINLFRKPK